MQIKLEPRAAAPGWMKLLSPGLAIALTLSFALLWFGLLGKPPLAALNAMLIAPVSHFYGIAEIFTRAAPLTLMASGLALCFRANLWNIGAEGQFLMGAVFSSGLALALGGWNTRWILIPIVLAGCLGGAIWGSIPALLRVKFNTNETLTSLMLNYVAAAVLNYLVYGPWKNPAAFNFPETELFSQSATLPILFSGTRIHLGVVFGIVAAIVVGLVLSRTLFGFQVRVVGNSLSAAQYSGISHNQIIWMIFLVSSALAGLAGACEVTGAIGQLRPSISPDYGYASIVAAFIARLNPIGVIFSSLLMALLYIGGETAQITLSIPPAVSGMFQGTLLLFLLATDVLLSYRVRWISNHREVIPNS
ncbi:ABC transporter permease [Phormidium tenue FACHB-886]|nr:ABC transporter permease [Phormidium tenue FACHB-886]